MRSMSSGLRRACSAPSKISSLFGSWACAYNSLGLLNRDVIVETAVDDQGGSIQLSDGTAQVVSFTVLEISLCEPLS